MRFSLSASSLLFVCIALGSTPASAGEFKYVHGVCQNAAGKKGFNRGVIGECGSAEGADLSGTVLRSKSLRGAHLPKANFSLARLTNVDFTGANLAGSRWTGATVESSKFVGVSLAGATFSRTYVTRSRFQGANLTRATGNGATFALCELDRATLVLASLPAADFSFSSIVDSDFSRSVLNDSQWMSTALDRVDFGKANLVGSRFASATWKNVSGESARFDQAEFSDTVVDSSKLPGSSWKGTYWLGGSITASDLERAAFAQARWMQPVLSGVNCSSCSWSGSRFDDLDASDLDLRNASLIAASVHWKRKEGIKLGSARYVATTSIEMTDAEYKDAGMVLVHPVGVFFNPSYVRTDLSGEARYVAESVGSFGDPGLAFHLDGDPMAWTAETFRGFSAILIPFLRGGSFAGKLPEAAVAGLQTYVREGGKIVFFAGDSGDYGNIPLLYRSIFNLKFANEAYGREMLDNATLDSAELAKTPLADKASSIESLLGVGHEIWGIPTSALPPNARPIYKQDALTAVFWNAYGKGSIYYAGQLWYEMKPAGPHDEGWLDLLRAILDL